MPKLNSYEKHFRAKIRDKNFRKLYEEESHRLKVAYEIAQLRKKEHFSQKKLAKKIGTTQSAIARIESGQQNLTTDKLQEIASAFDRNIEIKFVK